MIRPYRRETKEAGHSVFLLIPAPVFSDMTKNDRKALPVA